MPTCSEQYGPGWVGDYPNCTYNPSTPGGQGGDQTPFTGTVESLGYGDILAGSSWADDWQKFFDPYDIRGEEMATRQAGVDVGQLEEAWGLKEEQLGEAWGLKGAQLGQTLGLGREQLGETWRLQAGGLGEQWGGQRQELGAGARGAFQDVERMIAGMTQKGRGLTFGGQRRRQAEEEVSGAYKRSFGLGQSAYERAMESGQSRYGQALEEQTLGYEQAMETGQLGYEQALETGQLGLQQGRTDIYQGLESDIFGQREDYLAGQRGTLNMLLGSGIWDDDNPPPTTDPPPRCPPGQQMALPGSGQTGCVPIPGGYTPPTTLGPTQEPEYTGMGEEDICLSKGGTWIGGSCQYG